MMSMAMSYIKHNIDKIVKNIREVYAGDDFSVWELLLLNSVIIVLPLFVTLIIYVISSSPLPFVITFILYIVMCTITILYRGCVALRNSYKNYKQDMMDRIADAI